jgi:hypothetical protein
MKPAIEHGPESLIDRADLDALYAKSDRSVCQDPASGVCWSCCCGSGFTQLQRSVLANTADAVGGHGSSWQHRAHQLNRQSFGVGGAVGSRLLTGKTATGLYVVAGLEILGAILILRFMPRRAPLETALN